MKLTFLVVAIACLSPASVYALDLTGTWVGQWKCTAFDGEKFKPVSGPGDILTISQTGSSVVIGGSGSPWSGVVIADSKKPESKGELAGSRCTTDSIGENGGDEIARIKAKVNRAKGTGKLKGVSIYIEGNGTAAGTCKWSYKLADPADPGASACP